MSGNFEKTSFDWQLQLVLTQMGEAIEKFFQQSGDNVNAPIWLPPEWIFKALFWLVVVGLAAWLGWQLYQLLKPYLGMPISARGRAVPQPEVQAVLSEVQWLERSRSFAQQGNYREACRALYQAVLQKLDGAGVIPAQLSRTDGEYLNCLHTLPNPRPYQTVIRVHERLCFSDAPVTPEIFQRCEQAYQETQTS